MRGVIDDIHLANTAAALREKTGTEKTYKPAELAGGVGEAYEAGQNTIYDIVLNGGKRKNAEQTFRMWQCEYIRPPFVFKPNTRTIECFTQNHKLKKIEKQYFDFSGVPANKTSTQGHYYTCYYCSELEIFEDIGLPACDYEYTWASCNKLHTIELVRSTRTTRFTNLCGQCYALSYIRFEGEIGQNITFTRCDSLSIESLKDIILHLVDYSGTADEYAKTLTLSSVNWATIEAEGATAPGGITWLEYVNELGWNRG